MASASKIGRNEPCPCGSGKKYKHCCVQKKGQLTQRSRLFVGLLIVAAVVAVALAFRSLDGGSDNTCPPGQVWSSAHGHCH